MNEIRLDFQLLAEGVPVRTGRNALEAARDALAAIDASVSGRDFSDAQKHWQLSEEFDFGFRAMPNGVAVDKLHRVQALFLEALRALHATRDKRPVQWPEDLPASARDHLVKLVGQLDKVDEIRVTPDGDEASVIALDQVFVTQKIGRRNYNEESEVEGVLEMLDLGPFPVFRIRDRITERPVRCHFEHHLLSDVKAALGKWVVVEGTIRYREDGMPLQVQVATSIRLVPSPARSRAELFGAIPDLGGDAESVVGDEGAESE